MKTKRSNDFRVYIEDSVEGLEAAERIEKVLPDSYIWFRDEQEECIDIDILADIDKEGLEILLKDVFNDYSVYAGDDNT